MADIYPKPVNGSLPLSKGGDVVVDFLQKVDDVYTSYQVGVTLSLVVDTIPAPVVANAEISTYHALCRIESEVADTIPNRTRWRCEVRYPTVPATTVIPINGKIVRADG